MSAKQSDLANSNMSEILTCGTRDVVEDEPPAEVRGAASILPPCGLRQNMPTATENDVDTDIAITNDL
jgi:hypothetical protein